MESPTPDSPPGPESGFMNRRPNIFRVPPAFPDLMRQALELSRQDDEDIRSGEIDEGGDTQIEDVEDDIDAMSENPVAEGDRIVEEGQYRCKQLRCFFFHMDSLFLCYLFSTILLKYQSNFYQYGRHTSSLYPCSYF